MAWWKNIRGQFVLLLPSCFPHRCSPLSYGLPYRGRYLALEIVRLMIRVSCSCVWQSSGLGVSSSGPEPPVTPGTGTLLDPGVGHSRPTFSYFFYILYMGLLPI